MKQAFYYDTPFGRIGIAENGQAITNVFFGGTVQPSSFVCRETPLLAAAAAQLAEYAAGSRSVFALPLEMEGSEFEKLVWQALLTIPYGEVRTYAQIAGQIGRPAACRAVGRANGRNPLSLFVPCHRVIGTGGALTGYAGGLPMKEQLLRLEGAL